MPVKAAILGKKNIDINELRQELISGKSRDIRELLEPILLSAELIETSYSDKQQYFLTDLKVQGYVFSGSKWMAGWVLVLGKNQNELIGQLKNRGFMVFTDQPDIPDTTYIGSRDTSPIYFLQMMVRYGMVWGGIAPGDDHELGHFLEKDLPGLMIITDDLPPLKYVIALGLMKSGAPAIVPRSFPFPYGNWITADNLRKIVNNTSAFPNLRIKFYQDEMIKMPEYYNPAYRGQKIVIGKVLGGNNSFICVRQVKKISKNLSVTGKPDKEIGIFVNVAERKFSDDLSLTVEKTVLKSVNCLKDVRAYEKDGGFYLETGKHAKLNDIRLSQAVYWGIRNEFPRLKKIGIEIIYDQNQLTAESRKVNVYKEKRRQYLDRMSEQTVEEFCVCTECRPFSLVHTCILTPDRIPMCAARDYTSVKAAAYFGSLVIPYKRKLEKYLPLRMIFKKGKVINLKRGEYEGCNKIYRKFTNGKLKRVFLHSLRQHPITSCGCFQNLAFWIKEVKGIGIMSRGSDAVTPDGRNWEMLANQAGGKQSSGIAGVSLNYIKSPDFLKGDGGIKNVVWVDSKLYNRISDLFSPNQKVATEKTIKLDADKRR